MQKGTGCEWGAYELTSRAAREGHDGIKDLNAFESLMKSNPSSMKCLVCTEPLPHSTGPILCCHPNLWLLPKLSKHWLWQSVCRKGDFPRQLLVTSEEWETAKTCTLLFGHFGAFWLSSKAKDIQAHGRLSSTSAGQKPQEFNTKAKDSLDPAKELHHGSHSKWQLCECISWDSSVGVPKFQISNFKFHSSYHCRKSEWHKNAITLYGKTDPEVQEGGTFPHQGLVAGEGSDFL